MAARTYAGFFTHHQKTIILDAEPLNPASPGPDGKRRVVSFVGGLDLCDGRYAAFGSVSMWSGNGSMRFSFASFYLTLAVAIALHGLVNAVVVADVASNMETWSMQSQCTDVVHKPVAG